MNTRTILFLIAVSTLFLQCLPSNSSVKYRLNAPPNAKPGACYAKCMIPDQSTTSTSFLTVYTGDESVEDVDIEIVEITTKAASSEWKKKRKDNCVEINQNDCLVWCISEIPPQIKSYKILLDTAQSNNYVMEKVYQEEVTKKGGTKEWKEVLCDNQFNNEIYIQIQNGLINNEFYNGEIITEFDSSFTTKIKDALSAFQEANQLPIGQLDFETLDALGVNY